MARVRKQPIVKTKHRPKLRKPTFIGKLLKSAFNFLKKILKPFKFLSFLLWPFKTRPAKFIGRILSKVLLLGYFKNSWKELKQVTWPSSRETIQLTFAVFVFSFAFGLMVTVVDYGLSRLFEKVIL